MAKKTNKPETAPVEEAATENVQERKEVIISGQEEVVMLPISFLQLYEINPRVITDTNFRKLQQSIQRDPDFMYNRPILVNKVGEDHFIYAGSQRYKACLDLEWSEIPCIVHEDLPDNVLKSRMLLDNTHEGKWDDAGLNEFGKDMLEALDLTPMKVERVDFSSFNREEVLKALEAKQAGQSIMDRSEMEHTDFGRADSDIKEQHGGHNFNIIFADKEEHDTFVTLFNNLPKEKGQRSEDALVALFEATYPGELNVDGDS